MNESDFKSAMTQNSPEAEIGFPVNSISIATFLGIERPKATPGVEQNNPILTLK